MTKEQRKGTRVQGWVAILNSMIMVGLKDKLKVMFMMENWFLELNNLSRRNFCFCFLGLFVCFAILCYVFHGAPHYDHGDKCNCLLLYIAEKNFFFK